MQVKWVANAVRDYTVGIHSEFKIDLSECVGYREGSKDRCKKTLEGTNFKQGDSLVKPETQGNIEEELHYDIASFYEDLEDQPWIEETNKGWYRQLLGQLE